MAPDVLLLALKAIHHLIAHYLSDLLQVSSPAATDRLPPFTCPVCLLGTLCFPALEFTATPAQKHRLIPPFQNTIQNTRV